MTFVQPETSKPKEKELIPEGKYPARLFMVVDIGTRTTTWKGDTKDKHEIYLAWELIGTKMKDGRPFTIGKRFTTSKSKYNPEEYYIAESSNTHTVLKNWLSLPDTHIKALGDLVKNKKSWLSLIDGVPCYIWVGQKEDQNNPGKFNNIVESVKKYGSEDDLGHIENKPVFYILGKSKDNPGEDWDKLWPWQQKIVESCNEWAANEKALDDSIPF